MKKYTIAEQLRQFGNDGNVSPSDIEYLISKICGEDEAITEQPQKFTIADLSAGKVAVINDGTLKQLREALELAFPNDYTDISGSSRVYFKHRTMLGNWNCSSHTSIIPTQSVADFLAPLEAKEEALLPVDDGDVSAESIWEKHENIEREKHNGIVFKSNETIISAMKEYASLVVNQNNLKTL